jgi:hypothetical protein
VPFLHQGLCTDITFRQLKSGETVPLKYKSKSEGGLYDIFRLISAYRDRVQGLKVRFSDSLKTPYCVFSLSCFVVDSILQIQPNKLAIQVRYSNCHLMGPRCLRLLTFFRQNLHDVSEDNFFVYMIHGIHACFVGVT